MKEHAVEFADLWHHMPSKLERTGGFWLVRAGRNLAKPHYHVGPKQIDCYGWHVIVSGDLQLIHQNEVITLHAGDLFCLFPHMTYEYRIASPEPLRMVWLTMEGPQMRELMRTIGLTVQQPYRVSAMHRPGFRYLLHIEQMIWSETPEQPRLLPLLTALLRLFEHLEVDAEDRGTEKGQPNTPWIQEVLHFLQLHYAEPLRIEAIAHRFGFHRSYFTQHFKQKTEQSPQQYLQQLRLDRAKELLCSTSLSIGEIALSVGYPDLYMFSRAFKAQTGRSPTAYREVNHSE
ncbi:AraC family transcriptional regulator [Paenibacillus guangzhouensis]|uniref:AraC family transcriptional regulator n=1 Tax=Paenibacillus guangzhouensis TaxID=1473112 RepID=UPI0012673797|nr:AraC family transcriptional regulator [Paenibacillus guangzhouensis]